MQLLMTNKTTSHSVHSVSSAETEARCFLHMALGNHPSSLQKLLDGFGSALGFLASDPSGCKDMIPAEQAEALLNALENYSIDYFLRKLSDMNIDYIPIGHSRYPAELLHIDKPPVALFVRGSLPDMNRPRLAIIGARSCSGYGRQMARSFALEAAMSGIQIISGMAVGIDSIAGKAAFDGGGTGYAVLGTGTDVCYPAASRELYGLTGDKGGLISEFVPSTGPKPGHFPMRNRIISGLADAVLVIEAREHSGTLITVGAALNQGKDVYIVPGRIGDALSRGCNKLLREGAHPAISPVEFVEDFFNYSSRYITGQAAPSQCREGELPTAGYGITKKKQHQIHGAAPCNMFLTSTERAIINVLDYNPKSISEIFLELDETCPITLTELMSTLTVMTAAHKLQSLDGCHYCLRS